MKLLTPEQLADIRDIHDYDESHNETLVKLTHTHRNKLLDHITALEAQRLGFRKGCEELIDKWRQIYFIDNNQHGLVSGDTTYANDLDELLSKEQE